MSGNLLARAGHPGRRKRTLGAVISERRCQRDIPRHRALRLDAAIDRLKSARCNRGDQRGLRQAARGKRSGVVPLSRPATIRRCGGPIPASVSPSSHRVSISSRGPEPHKRDQRYRSVRAGESAVLGTVSCGAWRRHGTFLAPGAAISDVTQSGHLPAGATRRRLLADHDFPCRTSPLSYRTQVDRARHRAPDAGEGRAGRRNLRAVDRAVRRNRVRAVQRQRSARLSDYHPVAWGAVRPDLEPARLHGRHPKRDAGLCLGQPDRRDQVRGPRRAQPG